MQVLTTALIFPTASEGDREGAARHTGCHRPAEPLGYPTVQSLPETPQSTAVHGRGVQITTIYDAPKIEDIVKRAGQKRKGPGRPESAERRAR